MTMKHQYFECECHSSEHVLRLTHDDEIDNDPEWHTVSLETFLKPTSLFRRIGQAVKYMFGYRSRYGDFEEYLLSREEATKFHEELGKILEKFENNKENT